MSKEDIQKAFEVMMKDPRFVSLIKAAGLEDNEKLSDEELDKVAGGVNGDMLSRLGMDMEEMWDTFNALSRINKKVMESERELIRDTRDILAKNNEAQREAARRICRNV